jgi:predicted anti-sigma-YlaC factor YlaD
MTCRELTDFLADYFEGGLGPDRRAAFEDHLAVCGDCRRYLASYRSVLRLGRDCALAEPVALPEALVRAILAASRIA